MTPGGWQELALRFILGGAIVSVFAVVGEIFQPKTFAGIFGAAPSVALTTLGLAFITRGAAAADRESRFMILGAIAFIGYSATSTIIVRRRAMPVWLEAALSWLVWLAIAFAGWWAVTALGS